MLRTPTTTRITTAAVAAATLAVLLACADETRSKGPAWILAPSAHVGIEPRNAEVGHVANDFECHIGQRGFPTVVTHESHVTESSSGNITMTCHGQLPVGSEPQQAVVETGLLCFLPEGRTTRESKEVFTPSGRINLTCWYRP
jgi:hypothetical protein